MVKPNTGPKLPEKGTYLDDRFWLVQPDGSEVMYGWTGERWVAEGETFFIEYEQSLAERDKPAKLKPEGTPVPLRIFPILADPYEGPVSVKLSKVGSK